MENDKSFAIIKPEGLEKRLEAEIEKRILHEGLTIDRRATLVMNNEQFEAVYGHTQYKVPHLYAPMKDYLTRYPIQVMEISGEGAIEKLLKIRGASNPKYAAAGTIRGDFAKDQEYEALGKLGIPSKNIFHAADSYKEAKVAIDIFFGGERNE
jgi:nucleoside-diphosphate kinase